jgi:hypothetical protein
MAIGMAGTSRQRSYTVTRRRVVVCLALLFGAAAGSPPGSAVAADAPAPDSLPIEGRLDLLFGSHDPYRKFLQALQDAVATRDRNQIAAMVSYPLRTQIAGRVVKLDNPRHFLAHFDELLPQRSLDAISAQAFDGLFANSHGVMIGSGEVWFGAVCAARDCNAPPIMITALNPQPPPTP